MIDCKVQKLLTFALKVQSRLSAIPFKCSSNGVFYMTARSLNLFILSTVFLGINSISAAGTTISEDIFGSETVPGNTILRLFVLSTFTFAFVSQVNLGIHRQEFLTLVNQYSQWNSQFEQEAEAWKMNGKNNSAMYLTFFIPYQFNTPVIFGLLFLHSPEKLPSSYGIILRILKQSPVFELSQILPYLWVFVVMYEWALVMGIVHFYMFNLIVYCKEAIQTLKTISASLENRNVFIVQDGLQSAQMLDSVNIPIPHLLASLDGCPRGESFVMHLRKRQVPFEASRNASDNVHFLCDFGDSTRNTSQHLGRLGFQLLKYLHNRS
ncbi:unnamed protein product [Allacma fusca]|uniref:Uncharacterized protein n=1 Tax=Allacma fusca TaxID=39272 RepID=A0A8J2J4U8_9HEXA|nr:unnamed protein product [Allacma fusca]